MANIVPRLLNILRDTRRAKKGLSSLPNCSHQDNAICKGLWQYEWRLSVNYCKSRPAVWSVGCLLQVLYRRVIESVCEHHISFLHSWLSTLKLDRIADVLAGRRFCLSPIFSDRLSTLHLQVNLHSSKSVTISDHVPSGWISVWLSLRIKFTAVEEPHAAFRYIVVLFVGAPYPTNVTSKDNDKNVR